MGVGAVYQNSRYFLGVLYESEFDLAIELRGVFILF